MSAIKEYDWDAWDFANPYCSQCGDPIGKDDASETECVKCHVPTETELEQQYGQMTFLDRYRISQGAA